MKNTIENNKLIAEFLGYEKIVFPENSIYLGQYTNPISKRVYSTEEMQFHTDWDTLILVTRKMCKIKGIQDIEKYLENMEATAKIEDVYSSCISFIEWYNENKTEA
jgi:hypothetical protein